MRAVSDAVRRLAHGKDAIRFLIAGAANTLLTFAVYQMLLYATTPSAAYALSWLAGLGFVIIFYPSKVFVGARNDVAARFRFGLMYVGMFLLGLATLKGLSLLHVPPRLSIILVMAVTTISNFLAGRLVLGKSDLGARPPS